MFEKVKDAALPFAILLVVAIKLGMVGAGPSTPDFAKPAPKA